MGANLFTKTRLNGSLPTVERRLIGGIIAYRIGGFKEWFSSLTFVNYLDQLEYETGSGNPGNCNRIPGS